MRAVAVLGAIAAAVVAIAASGASAEFVPLAQFNCGSSGTFYSEVNPVPAPLPDPFAPAPEARVRLLTTTGGETNEVIVLLQVTSLSTGQVLVRNPGLAAESNPNLVTCTITRPNGAQFEAIGILTPG